LPIEFITNTLFCIEILHSVNFAVEPVA